MLHLDLFLLFDTFPELLMNIDVGSKAHLLQPCRRASQGVLFLTSNKKRFIMKSIFSRYPCFVINDNNYLCLYTSDTVSRIVKGVFSVAPPYKWTKYQKKILIYFRILWCHFIRCFNPTWPGDLIKKKKAKKKLSFDSDPP